MHYATSRKVAGSRPNEVNDFFEIYLILPAALGPGVSSASNKNEYQRQKINVLELLFPGIAQHLPKQKY
jgi:hypothetical protein